MQPNYSRYICKGEHGEFTTNYISPVEKSVLKTIFHGAVPYLVRRLRVHGCEECNRLS